MDDNKGADLSIEENNKIKEEIAVFEKDGPYTSEKVLEIAKRIVALGQYCYDLNKIFKKALAKVYSKFSLEELEGLYELAEDDKAIVDALRMKDLSELYVPLEHLEEDHVTFYGFHMPRDMLVNFASDRELMQTGIQRANLLRVLRQNAMVERKKSKK
jgi:hypothetical protein